MGQPFVFTGTVNLGRAEVYQPFVSERLSNFNAFDIAGFESGQLYLVSPPLRQTEEDASKPQGRYGHWFWGPVLESKSLYWQVGLSALFINIFALVSSIFSMIVYDRVMPNNAADTLTALVIGVLFVLIGDFVIRTLRAYFLDLAGAQADISIADTLFEQILDMQMKARKGSVGGMASVVRDFESIRDFFTSATLTALIDIPFAVIFIIVIFAVGGPLAWVPVIIAPFVILASLVVQPKLRKLIQISNEDGHNKHAVIVETLQGIETIKSLGAGSVMRRRWQHSVAHQAAIGLKTRMLSQVATNCANLGTQLVWVGTVSYGFFLIQKGDIGSGAIVACSMLAGRTIAPIAQLAQLLTRLNQTLSSYKAIETVMQQPREHKRNEAYIQHKEFVGDVEFRDVHFTYPGQGQGTLNGVSFKIKSGERVAFIGKIGSGKSTIAALMMAFYAPDSGEILVDGIDIRQLDPSDLRRNIGAVLQDIWLMTGTVKENIAIGGDAPSDQEITEASKVAGVHDFIAPHADGYGFVLRERGVGLSGGQRQAIAVARALVGSPSILLLDEPTSATDIAGERILIDRMKKATAGKTLMLITHRPSMVDLVDRVIVIDAGRVLADGPKEVILSQATNNKQNTSTETSS
jgi:ATP-binding cassette subfamily C protein LapB